MADIISFRGLLYNKDRIKNLDDICAPPYDVISDKKQDILYAKSDYNIVRLILGREYPADTLDDNRYTRAADCLDKWIKQEILKRDEKSSIYIYTQEYTYKDRQYSRRGFIALAKIEDYESGVILPHEHTLSKPKEDRLKLLRECKANLSQIFCLYSDPGHVIDGQIDKGMGMSISLEAADEDGIKHTLNSITDSGIIENIISEMQDKKLYIADGHHRYETALSYRDEQRKSNGKGSAGAGPYDYVMMYFTNMDSEEMTILPYNRLVHNIDKFDVLKMEDRLEEYFYLDRQVLKDGNKRMENINDILEKIRIAGKNGPVFGMYCGNNVFNILRLKNRDAVSSESLDVSILHELVFYRILGMDSSSIARQKNIAYSVDEKEAIDRIDKGLFQIAFFLNPTKMESLKRIVSSGGKMPQKSTFFYPKLFTGLVINKLD